MKSLNSVLVKTRHPNCEHQYLTVYKRVSICSLSAQKLRLSQPGVSLAVKRGKNLVERNRYVLVEEDEVIQTNLLI